MDFEDSKFQGPTRLIWIGDPRFATLGCFILALTAVPTKKHPTEVFGWLANKAVCAMRLLHHTPKRNITSSSMVPTCKVRQIFSRGKLASFLSTGPTKVHQHPHLVGFLREIFGGSQLYTPPKLNSSPPENDGKGRRSLEPFGCTGCC